MDIIFKDFVYDQNNCLRQNENGEILCTISDLYGNEDRAFLDKETLMNSNILPREDEQNTLDIAQDVDDKEVIEWLEQMTMMILDKYAEYIAEVGPMKKFRTKKKMWEYITNDNVKFKINRTAQQVENRFKTVLKRKKKAMTNNNQSGSRRTQIEFEDELNEIANIDDSFEPEVKKDQNQTTITSKINVKGEKESTCHYQKYLKQPKKRD